MMFSLVPAFTGMLTLSLLPTDRMKWVRWAMYILQVFGSLPGLSKSNLPIPRLHGQFRLPTPSLVIWTFLPSNIAGRTKKTVVSTILFIAYCVGNAIGAQIMRADDAPKYIRGITVCAVLYCVEFCAMGIWRFYCKEYSIVAPEDCADKVPFRRVGEP